MATMMKDGRPSEWKKLEGPWGDFSVKLRAPTATEVANDDAYLMRAYMTEDVGEKVELETRRQALRALVLVEDWKDVFDEDGKEVPFNTANLEAFIAQWPQAFTSLRNAGNGFFLGKAAAKERNGPPESNERLPDTSSGPVAGIPSRKIATRTSSKPSPVSSDTVP